MFISNVNHNISKDHGLWKLIVLNLVIALTGTMSKSVRGITLNFDGETIQINAIFEDQPTEIDIACMQNVEAELISHHNYQSDLVIDVIPLTESLHDKMKNWGWVYLRRED